MLTMTKEGLPLHLSLVGLLLLSFAQFLVFAVVYHIATSPKPQSTLLFQLMFVLLCAQMFQRGLHRFEVFLVATATLGLIWLQQYLLSLRCRFLGLDTRDSDVLRIPSS